ncbi:MAG: hypothetical protein V4501_04055 [Pseudomonadota bacterium]
MQRKLQLTNIVIIGIYSLLLTVFASHHSGHGIRPIVVSTAILFWSYFVTAIVLYKKDTLTASLLNVIRFNVYLNIFLLILYFVVVPVTIALVVFFPSLTFLATFMDRAHFGVLFLLGLLILLIANAGSFILLARNLLNRD